MAAVTQAAASTTSRLHLPLTTIFTPPTTCNDIVTYDGTSLWQNGHYQTGDPACYPSGFYKYLLNNYYSPGLCPESWTSVGSLSPQSGNDAMCCPNSYYLTNADGGKKNYCVSHFTGDLPSVYSTSTLASGPLPSNPQLRTINANNVPSNTVYADVIQVQWQDSDQQIIALMSQKSSQDAAKPTRTAQGSAVASKTDKPAATSAAMTSVPAPSAGLSTGAKIGIGVGVPLVVILIAAIAAAFFLRRRKQQKAIQNEMQNPAYSASPAAAASMPSQGYDPSQGYAPSQGYIQEYKPPPGGQRPPVPGPQYPPQTSQAPGFHELPPAHPNTPVEIEGRRYNEAPGITPAVELPSRGFSQHNGYQGSALSSSLGSPTKSGYSGPTRGTS